MRTLLCLLLSFLLLPLPTLAENEYGFVAEVATCSLFSAEAPLPSFIAIHDLALAEAYLEEGLIVSYEPNQPVYLFGQNVYYMQKNVELPAAWAAGNTGAGVRVGVLDSGVYPHTDFGDNLLPGYNLLKNSTDTTDTYGHGTRVAGLIAAAANDVGAKGAAPAASIVPLKAFETNETTLDIVANGIAKAVALDCDILNMSFGFADYSDMLATVVSSAQKAGLLLVAAAGNDGTNTVSYPAAYAGVIGVGAVDHENAWASYSQYGAHVDVVAPGCCIGSTDLNDAFVPISDYDKGASYGTSFSAPLVSGILALGKAAQPTYSADMLTDALFGTAKNLGGREWNTKFGYGLVDAAGFLEELPKMGKTHLLRTYDGISIYGKEAHATARLVCAQYEGRTLTSCAVLSVPVAVGYTPFIIALPKNSKVFLFDGMRPLGKALEISSK